MKKFLLKSLLVTVGLLTGGSAWGDTETINVLPENYESYSVGDIKSTMQSNGWTFQNKYNGPDVEIVQGSSANTSKYLKVLYNDGGSERNQYWAFPSSATSALTADNWTFSFDGGIAPGSGNDKYSLALAGTSSTGGFNANSRITGSTAFFYIENASIGSNTFSAKVGGSDVAGTFDLTTDTWYKFTIKVTNIDAVNNTATIYAKITSYDGNTLLMESTQNNVSTTSIGTLKGLTWYSPKNGSSRLLLDNVLLSKEVDASTCAEPTSTLTGASGTSRKFTLACETPASSIYYSETEKEYGDEGWIEYTSEVTTSAATIYIYAATASAHSTVTSFETGAGTAVKLNAPSISRSGNTVTITSDQSEKVGNPSATIYYTYGEGEPVEYSSAITVAADATITAYASYTGYTNSDNSTRAVAVFPTNVAKVINAPENNTYTTGALSGDDVVGTNATFQALMIDGAQWGGEDVFVQSTNFGFRNGGAGKDWFFNNTSDVWLLVKNLKAGDIIVVNTSYQASGLTNATYTEKYSEGNNRAYTVTADDDVELAFKKPDTKTMHYFYGLYVWSHSVSATIGATGWTTFASPYALDLSDLTASTGDVTAYYASAVGGGKVTMTSTEKNDVAAGQGIMLKGTAYATITIPVVASGTAISGNKLVGCTTETELDVNTSYYVLVNNSGTAEFQRLGTYGATIPAGKAYLNAGETNVRSLKIAFEDAETGINEVNAPEAATNGYYNLAGQRVANPTKGLYIVNGKKVIVK